MQFKIDSPGSAPADAYSSLLGVRFSTGCSLFYSVSRSCSPELTINLKILAGLVTYGVVRSGQVRNHMGS